MWLFRRTITGTIIDVLHIPHPYPNDVLDPALHIAVGTNLLLGPPEKFYCRNPSGTFRDVHWYHLDGPKKVPGAPSQGFLIFLGFHKNVTKIENWLSHPHFLAYF